MAFDLKYIENEHYTRETKSSKTCIDAICSSIKIDLSVLHIAVTDPYSMLSEISDYKGTSFKYESKEVRVFKHWSKLNAAYEIAKIDF